MDDRCRCGPYPQSLEPGMEADKYKCNQYFQKGRLERFEGPGQALEKGSTEGSASTLKLKGEGEGEGRWPGKEFLGQETSS